LTWQGGFQKKTDLEIWDVASGECLQRTPSAFIAWGRRAAFSADERRIVVAEDSGRIFVWEWQTAKIQTLREPKEPESQPAVVTGNGVGVAIAPDGKRVVACNLAQTECCWDAETGKLLWEEKQTASSLDLRFSPDGRQVVDLVHPTGFVARDAATGKRDGKPLLRQLVNQHLFFDFTPDGRQFVLHDSWSGEWFFVDPHSGKTTQRFPAPAHSLFGIWLVPTSTHAFTPDGKGFVRCDGALQRWDVATQKPLYPVSDLWGHVEAVSKLVFSPDGRYLVSHSARDGSAHVWDLGSGRTVHAVQLAGNHLALSPDGKHLLGCPAGRNGVMVPLRMWDVGAGRVVRDFEHGRWEGFSYGGEELRVTADGGSVLMLTDQGGTGFKSVLFTWNTENGRRLSRREVAWGPRSAITPDGRSVVTGDEDGMVRLVAVDTAKPRLEFRLDRPRPAGKKPRAFTLSLSPDGRLVAVRYCYYSPKDEDVVAVGPVYLGDTATGEQVGVLDFDGPMVFAFSPDSRLLAVAAGDRVQLRETATGKEVGSITMPAPSADRPGDWPAACALAFSPDGRTVATGHDDCTVLLWDATLRAGKRGGPLTPERAAALQAELAGDDARKAYDAVWSLADDPSRSVPLFRKALHAVTEPTAAEMGRLIADLDSDQFPAREAADRKLRQIGERAEPALRLALAGKVSAECQRRLQAILAALGPKAVWTPEQLGVFRSVMALEKAGTADARQVLEDLARGLESARQTQAARDALRRMGMR
jgi:WD40 repeat protein